MRKRKKSKTTKKVSGNPAKQAEYEKKIQRESLRPEIPLPPFITCNECGGEAPQSTFEMLETDNMDGVDIAFIGTCKECGYPTIAASGNPQAVSAVMSAMMEEVDGSKIGMDAFK